MSDDFLHEPVETGLLDVTATVTTKPAGLSPADYQAAKTALAIPPDKATPVALVALARDIALDLQTIENLLLKHGLTNAQYEFLAEHNEFFKRVLEQQAGEWQGIKTTQERLRVQAAAGLEAQLPVLASRMGKQTEKLGDAVEAAKLFAKIAGVDAAPDRVGAAGEGFTISIDLGADTRLIIGAPPLTPENAPVAETKTIEGKVNQ